jgi:hypothetical protein
VYPFAVQITIDIPDDLVAQYLPVGHDASRAVLEDALVQAYREERISGRQLMEALGIPTRYELDGFLKARQVWIEYTPEEMAADQRFQEEFVRSRAKKSA